MLVMVLKKTDARLTTVVSPFSHFYEVLWNYSRCKDKDKIL